MSEELRACPFCGKQEVEIVIEHGCETLPNYKKFYFTNCKNCGSLIDSYRIIDELVAHFNTRPIEDALQSEIACLTAEIAALKETNRWIPVSESLPEKDWVESDKHYDVTVKFVKQDPIVMIAVFHENKWLADDDPNDWDDITMWVIAWKERPLPQLSEKEE